MVTVNRLYSLLLRAYPFRLRNDRGAEMLQLFLDQFADARERGETGRFYLRVLSDWLRTVPIEHYFEYRRRGAGNRSLTPVRHLLRRGLVFAPNPSAAIVITVGVLAWRCVRRLQRNLK